MDRLQLPLWRTAMHPPMSWPATPDAGLPAYRLVRGDHPREHRPCTTGPRDGFAEQLARPLLTARLVVSHHAPRRRSRRGACRKRPSPAPLPTLTYQSGGAGYWLQNGRPRCPHDYCIGRAREKGHPGVPTRGGFRVRNCLRSEPQRGVLIEEVDFTWCPVWVTCGQRTAAIVRAVSTWSAR